MMAEVEPPLELMDRVVFFDALRMNIRDYAVFRNMVV